MSLNEKFLPFRGVAHSPKRQSLRSLVCFAFVLFSTEAKTQTIPVIRLPTPPIDIPARIATGGVTNDLFFLCLAPLRLPFPWALTSRMRRR